MRRRAILPVCALVLLMSAAAGAAQPPQGDAAESRVPSLSDIRLTLPGELGALDFYGKERLRWQVWDYPESAPFDNAYDFYASQMRLGAHWDQALLKAHAAYQYTHLWGLPTGASAGAGAGASYFSNGILQTESYGTYVKYLEATWKKLFLPGWSVTVGRMDYSSGNEYKTGKGSTDAADSAAGPAAKKISALKSSRIADRLVGGFGWSEYQRSFDGVKIDWDHAVFHGQAAAFSPTQGGFEDNAGKVIDDLRVYATEWVLKREAGLQNAELSLFYVRSEDSRRLEASSVRPDNTGRSAFIGAENDVDMDMVGGSAVGAWGVADGLVLDGLFWGVWQSGGWYELDHEAYALAAEGGLQWTRIPWKPWLRGGWNIGSGDDDPADAQHGTFYPLLPTARLYSSSILYNTMNLEDVFVSVTVKPLDKLTLKSDIHWLSLTESTDRWYVGSGAMNRSKLTDYAARASGGSDDLGTLVDLQATWELHSRVSISAYYGHFFGGDVAQRFYTRDEDADFFYLEATISF